MTAKATRLKALRIGDVTVAELVDRKLLEETTIAQVGLELFALAGAAPAPRMVLDFINVAHMSSSALGMLITLHKRVREKDGQLRLCNIRPSIREVFSITRLDEVIRISPSRDEAVREADMS